MSKGTTENCTTCAFECPGAPYSCGALAISPHYEPVIEGWYRDNVASDGRLPVPKVTRERCPHFMAENSLRLEV